MRIVVYIRVSGHLQEREATHETQLFEIQTWATEKGHTIVAIYQDLACSHSVPIPERQDGGRLLRDAAAPGRGFDAVVVWDRDRWACIPSIYQPAVDELARHGVKFLTLGDNLEPSPDEPNDEFMVNVKLSASLLERRQIRRRCVAGRYHRATARASYLGGVVPWGFAVVRDAHADPNDRRRRTHLEPDWELIPAVTLEGEPVSEASVIRWAYERKAYDRWTHCKIAAALRRASVPTATQNACGRHRRHIVSAAVQWREDTIGKMLRNPIYMGFRDYGSGHGRVKTGEPQNRTGRAPVRQEYPPIVTAELWQAAQEVMRENELNSGRHNQKHFYLLRTKIFCAHCHGVRGGRRRWVGHTTMDPRTRHPIGYYECPCRTACPFGRIRLDELEHDLWETLVDHLRDQKGTLAKIQAHAGREEEQRAVILKRRDGARALQVTKQRALDKTVDLVAEELLTKAEGQAKLVRLRDELAELTREIADHDRELTELALTQSQLGAATDHLAHWRSKLTAPLTWDEKRAVIEQFVREIVVTEAAGNVVLIYRFCFDPNPLAQPKTARLMKELEPSNSGWILEARHALARAVAA